MKRIILNVVIAAGMAAMLPGCDTSTEELDLQPAYKYNTQEYYANLRAFKDNMKNREISWVWFADYSQNTSPGFRFSGLPDSLDIISLWGGIPDPVKNPVAYKEMWEMRRDKGTKLLLVSFTRIFENEKYAEYGLTRDDVISQKKTIDPTGTYADWIVLYAEDLLGQVFDNNLDGLDLDYEPEAGDEVTYGFTSANMVLFVKYVSQFIGPKSPNPHLLFCVDYYGRNPSAEINDYVDYFVKQAYTQSGNDARPKDSDMGGHPTQKVILTENMGLMWNAGFELGSYVYREGGVSPLHAAFKPSSTVALYGGRKGGFGMFMCQRDYNIKTTGHKYNDYPYQTLRECIQIQNPAMVK